MKDSQLTDRIEYLYDIAKVAIANRIGGSVRETDYVSQPDYIAFKAAALSFIDSLYGTEHSYYRLFMGAVNNTYVSNIESGMKVLAAIKHEIDNGWLTTVKQLVTAEVFSNFLEMAEHLLDEGYKDAAAVMIGSVLEEHLRQLCATYGVDTHVIKGTDNVPKKASTINEDLKKAGAYGPIQVKQVTAWFGTRNSAAHGHYGEYTLAEVKIMYQGVLNFLSEVK
ncbi:hypothetical protein [Mucilaginibacter dorajii]|uniref:DUF4145 domain-containing protein n=1 Tax=Mucilaginibacter dorajii TaxID=692994 RepID=A0ABP7PQF2_9SPHI|nr:hypothetical protein [Mucilaginibacter dorajii]MCS3736929.1 hypothetical protein [Mucilaginibacter dorajii]